MVFIDLKIDLSTFIRAYHTEYVYFKSNVPTLRLIRYFRSDTEHVKSNIEFPILKCNHTWFFFAALPSPIIFSLSRIYFCNRHLSVHRTKCIRMSFHRMYNEKKKKNIPSKKKPPCIVEYVLCCYIVCFVYFLFLLSFPSCTYNRRVAV